MRLSGWDPDALRAAIVLLPLAVTPDLGCDLLQKIARTQRWQDTPPDAAGVYRVLRDMERRRLIRSHMAAASKAVMGKRVFETTDEDASA